MRRLLAWLLASVVIVVIAPLPATAEGCPAGFHLHEIGDADHEHNAHEHVGLSLERLDRNQNGWICVKHVSATGDIHVHIDDLAS